MRAAKAVAINSHRVTGRVVSAADGSPMPGVNVMVKGSSLGAVTDGSGSFELTLSQPNQELVFSFIGYEQLEVEAGQKDKLDVSLKEDATQLSEIVVTGYSLAQENEGPVIKLAEPTGGRKAYDKYLDDNVRYPQQVLDNKVKGRVVIEFTVRVDGSVDWMSAANSSEETSSAPSRASARKGSLNAFFSSACISLVESSPFLYLIISSARSLICFHANF